MRVTVHYSLDENVLLLLSKPAMRLVMKLQFTGMPELELFGMCD